MKLHYEKAKDTDIELLYECNRELVNRYEDMETIDYDRVMQWIRQKLQKHIREYTCVTAEGVPVAYFHFYPAGQKMELDDLYVMPAFRNQGFGTEILKKCLAETPLPVFLYVFAENKGAVALYERMGFRVVERVSKTRLVMEYEGRGEAQWN